MNWISRIILNQRTHALTWESALASVWPRNMDTMRSKCLVLLWVQNKHNHQNDPALKKNLGFRPCRKTYSSLVKSFQKVRKKSLHAGQENPSDKRIIRVQYKMEGPVHQWIGIKWTLLCKIAVCFKIKRSMERHSCKGQQAASTHF